MSEFLEERKKEMAKLKWLIKQDEKELYLDGSKNFFVEQEHQQLKECLSDLNKKFFS